VNNSYISTICLFLYLIKICLFAVRVTEESKKNMGVDCYYTYWPDRGPISKGGAQTKTNDRCSGDNVVNFPRGGDGKWRGGGRWDCSGKRGGTKRWVYGERWAKGWWGVRGKAGGGGVSKGGTGRKKGDRGGRSQNFPPGGKRGGGNIMELESLDYEADDND
jgi:hypothetical protein